MEMGLKDNRLLDPYDGYSWAGIILSIVFLTTMIVITIKIYQMIQKRDLAPCLDLKFIVLRLLFGVTEPDRITLVNSSSFTTGDKSHI